MPKKPAKYKPQPACEHCDGLHYGSYKCPYLENDPAGFIAAHQAEQQPKGLVTDD